MSVYILSVGIKARTETGFYGSKLRNLISYDDTICKKIYPINYITSQKNNNILSQDFNGKECVCIKDLP